MRRARSAQASARAPPRPGSAHGVRFRGRRDQADAAARLDAVETQGSEVVEEIAQWRKGLERMEKAVEESEARTKKNMEVVEGWVGELEGRVKQLK